MSNFFAKKLNKEGNYEYPVTVKTNFPVIDCFAGFKENTKKDGLRIYEGVDVDRIIGIVGPSGVGKSTLAQQLAYGIISNFEDKSHVFIRDHERSNSYRNIQRWLGMFTEDIQDRFTILEDYDKGNIFIENHKENIEPLTIENTFSFIKQLAQLKLENKDELMTVDKYGTPYLIPTVIIVDSFAFAISESELSDSAKDYELASITAAPKRAQHIKFMLTNAIDYLKKGNIVLIYINHINDDVSIAGQPKKTILRDMKQGTTIPGGKGLIFATNLMFILDRKSKMVSTKSESLGYGKANKDNFFDIDGIEVEVKLAKSRSSATGGTRNLIFIPEKGYQNELSTFNTLLQLGVLDSKTVKYEIPGYDKKFYKKEFIGLIEDENFRTAFMTFAEEELRKTIQNKAMEMTPEQRDAADDAILLELEARRDRENQRLLEEQQEKLEKQNYQTTKEVEQELETENEEVEVSEE